MDYFFLLLKGDRVFGIGPTGIRDISNGVLREYILVKQDHMVKVPENLSLREASCFPCTGFTAYCFLVEKAKLKEGDKVFIHGGSGVVGVMAVQLARTIVGPTGLVVATCSPSKINTVRSLGAHEVRMLFLEKQSSNVFLFQVIDYTSTNLPDFLREHYSSRPFDLILDTVGNDHALYSNSPAYLAPSGLFCTIGIVDFGIIYFETMIINSYHSLPLRLYNLESW